MLRSTLLSLTLLLAGCGDGGGDGSSTNIPAPGVGQWVAFGGNEPTIKQGTQPSWDFPLCPGSQGCNVIASYFYTALGVTPKAGATLTMNFTVDGSNPVWQQQPASGGNSVTDTNPPTLHLFLWRKGDNLSCTATNSATHNGGFADYRLFAARTPLVLGANQSVSASIDQWVNCWGAAPVNITDELNNLLGVGVTFGGQSFAGHGIYLSDGSAKFTVNSLVMK